MLALIYDTYNFRALLRVTSARAGPDGHARAKRDVRQSRPGGTTSAVACGDGATQGSCYRLTRCLRHRFLL
jgi:hypothetical protein